ncbi:ANKLE2 [Mytilus coruscus]|uniref:ANKLE2 n=1 Tax=Mytilus coruscus TaxID=42192 RepID=A0A6J8D4Y7_MYTCO|nr:ANKLE2 [Mytilus coruscus]
MDDILNEVKKLSVADLRSKLLEVGEKVGPITATTQNLFQKRLAKRLYQIQHPELSTSEAKEKDVVNNNATPDNVNSEKIVAKVKDTEDSKTSDVPPVFFGVCLPQGVDKKETEDEELVFKDKAQALQAVKKYAGARFKVFKSRQDARLFSQSSADEPSPSPWKPSSPKKHWFQSLGKRSTTIETLVWENPRFLISSADTPLIIQEGPRYNGLHVAAKSNQPQVCQLILDILEDPSFLDKLYGHTKETECTRTDRMNFVVDLYLNTPDKGCCESPLHFACKFGLSRCWFIVLCPLLIQNQFDKILKNKYAETPRDVICARLKTPTQDQKAEIRDLLEGQFYVPLLRAEDNSTQPLIGQPWSPDSSKVPLNVATGTWSPKDPLMAVKACAGPMTPSKAVLFHKRWMTPPSGSPDHVKQKFVFTKREDSDKGVERIGREIAHEYQIPWVEYWSFLQTYADLTTEDGLDLLKIFCIDKV